MPDPTRKFLDDLHKQLNTLEKRLRYLETYETGGTRIFMVHNAAYVLNGVDINSGTTTTTGDLRGTNGVSDNATGVIIMVQATAGGANPGELWVDSKQAPDVYSPRLRGEASSQNAEMLFVELNVGGTVSLTSNGTNFTGVYMWVVGYWV